MVRKKENFLLLGSELVQIGKAEELGLGQVLGSA